MTLFDMLDRARSEKDVVNDIAKLEKRVKKAADDGDFPRASSACQLAARAAREGGMLDKAIEYALRAADYSLKDGNEFNAGWSYKIAAQASYDKGDYPGAIKHALESVKHFLKDKSNYAAQWSYRLAARASEDKKDLCNALMYLEKCLELGKDSEVEEELKRLKSLIPHPVVDQWVDHSEVREGEKVDFGFSVSNTTKAALSNVRVEDRNGNVVEKIDTLKPGEKNVFSHKASGEVGTLKSKCEVVRWKCPHGMEVSTRIEPPGVRIKPNVKVSNAVSPKLRLGKPSDFAVLVKNMSKSAIEDVEIDLRFPEEFEVKREGPGTLKKISPGEEKGFVFKLTPKTVGETVLRGALLRFRDSVGNDYREPLSTMLLKGILTEEPAEPPEPAKYAGAEEHAETLEGHRKHLHPFMEENPISESEYLDMTKEFFSAQRGYSLDGVSMDALSSHVKEECSMMSLVCERKFKDERLLMFSGKSVETGNAYLLTAVLKQGREIINALFMAYSDEKEGLEHFISKLADIVKYTTMVMSMAREVEKIEVKEVINIIDSVVQRSKIGMEKGRLKSRDTKIKDSVVQRSEV